MNLKHLDVTSLKSDNEVSIFEKRVKRLLELVETNETALKTLEQIQSQLKCDLNPRLQFIRDLIERELNVDE
jgi:hypothetical protein